MRLAWWCFDAVGPESRCCNVSELADTLEGDLKFLDHLINFIPIVRNRDFEIKTIPAMRIREFFSKEWAMNIQLTSTVVLLRNSNIPQKDAYCGLRRDLFPAPNCTILFSVGAEWCGLFRLEPRALAMETRPREGRVLTIRYELVHHDDLWQHTTSYIINQYVHEYIVTYSTIWNAFGALVSSWFGSEAAVCCQCLMMVVDFRIPVFVKTSNWFCLWK